MKLNLFFLSLISRFALTQILIKTKKKEKNIKKEENKDCEDGDREKKREKKKYIHTYISYTFSRTNQ